MRKVGDIAVSSDTVKAPLRRSLHVAPLCRRSRRSSQGPNKTKTCKESSALGSVGERGDLERHDERPGLLNRRAEIPLLLASREPATALF
mmetsp:Transcript_25635/g.71482  ORF Transcript_25635/g.71482 Transcript_25635/m.71482 type:complete len:90 (+) Transcript_25635:113-382(+)